MESAVRDDYTGGCSLANSAPLSRVPLACRRPRWHLPAPRVCDLEPDLFVWCIGNTGRREMGRA